LNRRRAIATLAALGSPFVFRAAGAQQPGKLRRVAILMYGSPANFAGRADAFTSAMRELGYEPGKNIHYDWRSANGQDDLLRKLAEEVSREPFDVIVSASANTTRALQKATKTRPIVMGSVEDPVGEGFARSLAQPGTNMTGVTSSVVDHLPKQLELLADVVPHLTTVTAALNPANVSYRAYRDRLDAAATRRKLKLVIVDAKSAAQIEAAFAPLAANQVGAVLVMNDAGYYNERAVVAEIASGARRPAIYPHRGYVEAGGLISYGPNPEANFTRAAYYVDRILKGAKPSELPIEPPSLLETVIHRGAALALGLTIPPDLLNQSTVIIS
jgi:putative ABC transport system substrate-binding protein